jgi:transcriptional regulator with XRE-family HTH domain
MVDPGGFGIKDSAEVLRHLFRLYGLSQAEVMEQSAKLGPRFTLSKNLFANTEHSDSTPLLPHLYALAHLFGLTVDGAYRIFQKDLDKLIEVEHHFNASRTRLIESYVYSRDRNVRVPRLLGFDMPSNRNVYHWELVESWQRVPIRSLEGPPWHSEHTLYARLGAGDDMASPAIPRGALLQGTIVTTEEARRPNPECYYLIQHGHGYLCCRCFAERGFLHLLAHGNSYEGPRRFRLGEEAQVIARASAFFTSLPPPTSQVGATVHGPPAPIIPPWQHRSVQELLATERTRFGLTVRQLDELNFHIRSMLGFRIGGRQAREIEGSHQLPHTPSILALTPAYSLRFQDVLRAAGLPIDDTARFSLATLLKARRKTDLPLGFAEAEPPRPPQMWSARLRRWQEWPALLSLFNPDLPGATFDLMELNQTTQYGGLAPLLPSGSIVLVRNFEMPPPQHIFDEHKLGWDRPIYLVRIRGMLLCSYIEAHDRTLTLTPHPGIPATEAIRVPRQEAGLVGLLVGALVSLQ